MLYRKREDRCENVASGIIDDVGIVLSDLVVPTTHLSCHCIPGSSLEHIVVEQFVDSKSGTRNDCTKQNNRYSDFFVPHHQSDI